MKMRVRDLLRRLKDEGWMLKAIEGSHHHYIHPVLPGKVTIAYRQEGDEIGGYVLNSTFKRAGWK